MMACKSLLLLFYLLAQIPRDCSAAFILPTLGTISIPTLYLELDGLGHDTIVLDVLCRYIVLLSKRSGTFCNDPSTTYSSIAQTPAEDFHHQLPYQHAPTTLRLALMFPSLMSEGHIGRSYLFYVLGEALDSVLIARILVFGSNC